MYIGNVLSDDLPVQLHSKLDPAQMWVSKDICEFKSSMKAHKDNVIHIGSLATATVSSSA